MSAAGLGMAILFVLEPAPDVALVQIVVDLLATVILVLALARIPRRQRAEAQIMAEAEYREVVTGAVSFETCWWPGRRRWWWQH